MNHAPRILIVRTDNLGDVVLTLPLCGVIKHLWPEARVGFVGKAYTQPIIEACQWVDAFWDREQVISSGFGQVAYDIVLHVFPDRAMAKACRTIPTRVGTSHRWWHWLTCNVRPSFTRKNSPLHEAQLNLELLRPLLNQAETQRLEPISTLSALGQLFGLRAKVPSPGQYVVLHPKSAGSAREWPMTHYLALARLLVAKGYPVAITGTAKEGERMKAECPELFTMPDITDLTGALSLSQLIALLGSAMAVVACSTGPLHIASAQGILAIGLYPPIRPMHPGRWAPLGPKAHVLVMPVPCRDCEKTQNCHCIQAIEVSEVMALIETA